MNFASFARLLATSLSHGTLSLETVSPSAMVQLQHARGKHRVTDVLAFPDPVVPASGLIVVCDKAVSAKPQHHSDSSTYMMCALGHATLHLHGYDHETDDEYQRMHQREKQLLRSAIKNGRLRGMSDRVAKVACFPRKNAKRTGRFF